MPRRLLPALAALLLVAFGISPATAEEEKKAPSEEEIQQAVKDLSSSEFLKREQAAKLLWEAGRAAKPALEAAVADTSNLEAKLRAEQILKKFRYGIYPDTPPELAEMLTLFRDGNDQQRRAIFAQLMQKQDIDTVLDLLETLPDGERNTFTQTMFRNSADKLVAPLIARADLRRAETVLNVMSQHPDGARDFAAFHLFSGSLEKALDAQLAKPDAPSHFPLLSALHRAKGDLPAALDAAKKIPSEDVQLSTTTSIRIAQGDIRAYLDSLARSGDIETTSLALTNARLQGDTAKADQLTREILDLVKADPDQIWYITEALLINDRPDAILELLKTDWSDRAAEILIEQRRPADVLAVLGVADPANPAALAPWIDEKLATLSRPTPGAPGDEIPVETRRQRLDTAAALVRIANLHVRIGYLPEADRLFTRIGDAVIAAKSGPHELGFVVSETAQSRRVEAAISTVRNALEKWPEAGEAAVASLPLDSAGDWWGSARNIGDFDPDLLASFDRFLKVYPDESRNPESRSNDKGEEIKPDPAAVAEAKSLIGAVLKNAEENGRPFFPGIGSRAEALGLLELAEDAFTSYAKRGPAPAVDLDADRVGRAQVDPSAPLRALGDFYARQKRWPDAVEAYRSASETTLSSNPVSVYTLSWALKNSGDEKAAADSLKLARLLPLGDVTTRNQLAEEMWLRDDSEAALAEWKYIFENASPEDWEQGRAAQMLAEQAAQEDRWDDAANYLDRLVYSTLQASSAFTEVRSYLRVRYRANYFRAMAAIARKDGPAAAAAANAAFVHQPTDPTISEEVFPALDTLEQKAAVDAMFDRAFKLNADTCTLFPDDPQAHNSLAWLAARSNRRLDDAFTHATRAVELDPQSAAYIDTLAETHFARGDRAKAIELSEKAVALMPEDKELQGQLQRFKGE